MRRKNEELLQENWHERSWTEVFKNDDDFLNEEDKSVESKFAEAFAKTRTWIEVSLGIIITLIGGTIIFLVASLEGVKEIPASNLDSGKLLVQWRIENQKGEFTFPEQKTEIMNYKNKEYYFVVSSYDEETNEIIDWYWAYDSGFGYIFGDYKFWVLSALTFVIALYVSYINYVSTARRMMSTKEMQKTLLFYKKKKEKIEGFTQHIPAFCFSKNKQLHESAKRDIVEEASIDWEFYNSGNFKIKEIEKWQRKKIKKIKKIKIIRMHSSDLLQEQGALMKKMSLLPMSQSRHLKRFLISGGVQKLFTSILSGMVISFGVRFGNWGLGLTYGFVVIMSFVTSIVVATDFVQTTLRNRFLAKADLLNEFDNIKQRFIDEEKEKEEKLKLALAKKNEAPKVIVLSPSLSSISSFSPNPSNFGTTTPTTPILKPQPTVFEKPKKHVKEEFEEDFHDFDIIPNLGLKTIKKAL